MFNEDLRLRTNRLIAGTAGVNDLDRIYIGLRSRAYGRQAFREVGDFVAHRDQRQKGMLTEVGRAIFTSADVWSMKMRKLTPTHEDHVRAAWANLTLATDKQIKDNCRCRRDVARKRLERALPLFLVDKLSDNDEDTRALNYFGGTFIWRPAFNSDTLLDEFSFVLQRNGLIDASGRTALKAAKTFIALHAISVMHGSTIDLGNGKTAELYAGYANEHRHLEIKIHLIFQEMKKPLTMPICLYLTNLVGDAHCEPALQIPEKELGLSTWTMPIEVTAAGRLDRLQ
ncbi:hypothetical protein FV218_07065 [Methylobacterium sp. WL69]|uniref:hypothetical protein n=1 Tax=Methylobacterium sp. WL69 TaxID=2603893 RepID=UPI0011C80FBD|nr:hypothetical protein [Methylobacterium sp. WL69]TXM76514.1 hypothetical protein FV218_07065 [Methylobacterium sp. WL69]